MSGRRNSLSKYLEGVSAINAENDRIRNRRKARKRYPHLATELNESGLARQLLPHLRERVMRPVRGQ